MDDNIAACGKPVLMIYEIGTFIDRVGGIGKAAESIAFLRTEAVKAGFPNGIHLMACDYGLRPEWTKALGIDSATIYTLAAAGADASIALTTRWGRWSWRPGIRWRGQMAASRRSRGRPRAGKGGRTLSRSGARGR